MAGVPISSHAYQQGVHFTNPSIKKEDKLVFCILPTAFFNEVLATPGHIEVPAIVKKVGPNVVWVKPQDASAANASPSGNQQIIPGQQPVNPPPAANGGPPIQGQPPQQSDQLQQQARMTNLEQQLDELKKSLAGGRGAPQNAAPLADQADAIPPEAGTHVPANVGHWLPTKRGSKWTVALVKEHIGESVIQRKGMYFIYTAHYHQSAVTAELENAFSAATPTLCANALKAAKLPIADIQDLHANQEVLVMPVPQRAGGQG